jgi:hypothetical protein
MQIEVPLKDIMPNPHRRIEHYPIIEAKVVALLESYNNTKYWGNVIVRPHPTKAGKYQLVFGHHRWEAWKRYYKQPTDKIPVIVQDLSEEMMLKMMGNENMEDWASNALVDIETVHAVVQAFAKGEIQLKTPPATAVARNAPSFIPIHGVRTPSNKAYTAETIAEFLGWWWSDGKDQRASRKVPTALRALEYIEEGLLSESDFAGLSSTAAEKIIEAASVRKKGKELAAALHEKTARESQKQAEEAGKAAQKAEREMAEALRREREAIAKRRAQEAEAQRAIQRDKQLEAIKKQQEETEARRRKDWAEAEALKARKEARTFGAQIIKDVASKVKAGDLGVRKIAAEADKAAYPHKAQAKPDIASLTATLANEIYKILGEDDLRARKIEEIAKFRHVTDIHYLARSLDDLSKRSADLAKVLREPTHSGNGKPAKRAPAKQLNYALWQE